MKIYNSGTVEGFIYGSYTSGVRTYIENSGIVIGDIWASSLGLGASTIINRGEVRSSVFGGMDDDTIILVGGSRVGGTVDAFDGNDTLILDNMGAQDSSLWGGPDGKYYNFENLSFTGADNRLTGTWQISDVPVTVYDGALTLQKSASIHAASLDVQKGGAASLLGSAEFVGAVTVSGSLASWGGLSAGPLLVNHGGSTVFYGSTTFGGAAKVNGNLVNRGDLSASGLYIGGTGSARLYGKSAVSGRVANAGSLLVGGDLNAGHVESSGELRVNGVLASPEVIITQSGELFGSGRIKADVTNSGAVNPGNSAGTLTIEGDYTHNRTAVMITEAAADGQTDLLYVTGRASINGGTLRVALEKALYADNTSWTVLRADGGLFGDFARMEGLENSAVLDFKTFTTANSLMVRLSRRDYADFAANPNDAQIAHALDRLLFSSTGELKEMLMSMDWNMSAAQIRRALDELSPEMYTAFLPASFQLGRVFDRAVALRMEQLDLKGPAGKNAAGNALLAAGRAGLVLPPMKKPKRAGPSGAAAWGTGPTEIPPGIIWAGTRRQAARF